MDEDLLNSYETDYSDYDLDNEKEDALLKEEDEGEAMMAKGEHEGHQSSPCASEEEKLVFEEPEEEDILNLNYDEDEEFKLVEDKEYEEDDLKPNRSEKFASERQQQNQISQKPTTIINRNKSPSQKCKEYHNNYNFQNHNNRRRGNFQHRGRNRERRNGTVFINQNYQGVVQLTNNNTRLAWDNKPQNNSNFIDPWGNNVRPQRSNQILSQVPALLDIQTSCTFERPNTFQPSTYHQPPARQFYQPPPPQPSYQNQNYSQWNGPPYNTYNYCQPEPPKVQVASPVYPPMTSVPPPGFQGRSSFEPQFNSTQLAPPPSQQFSEFHNNYDSYGYENYSADTNKYQQENRYDNIRPSNNFNKQYDHENFNNRNSFNGKVQIHSIVTKKFHSEPTENKVYSSNYQENKSYNNTNYYNNQVEKKPFQQNANNKFAVTRNYERKLVQTTRQSVISQVQKSSEPSEKKPKLEPVVQIEPEPQEIVEDEEDEETKQYRLKIEEQKRERERILQIKEQRRRQNLQKQQEEVAQQKIPPPRSQLNNIQVKKPAPVRFPKQTEPAINIKPEPSNDIPIIKKVIHNNIKQIIPETKINSGPSSSQSPLNGFMANRVVLVKNSKNSILNNNSDDIKSDPIKSESSIIQGQKSPQSSFMHNRKILAKDKLLLNTKLIAISNLSKDTTSTKLVDLTRGIGEIQNLQMDAQKRHATILFKAVASAHAFFKKYQRYMLDLSIIEVKLEPLL